MVVGFLGAGEQGGGGDGGAVASVFAGHRVSLRRITGRAALISV